MVYVNEKPPKPYEKQGLGGITASILLSMARSWLEYGYCMPATSVSRIFPSAARSFNWLQFVTVSFAIYHYNVFIPFLISLPVPITIVYRNRKCYIFHHYLDVNRLSLWHILCYDIAWISLHNDLRSSLLTLGKVEASFILFSLKRSFPHDKTKNLSSLPKSLGKPLYKGGRARERCS
jgi:hypothetical protein